MTSLFLQSVTDTLGGLLPMFLMLGVIVVFMVIPQRRKAKEQKDFLDSLQKGKEVVTASGILGRIDKIEDAIVTLNVGNKTYIRCTKNAISKELTDAIYPPDTAK
ncbi:preprotein translocase subunit YajC [Neolewinella aurantiaca]|uniref:Sec translocon accessory complex subunit YajC n=1 Tax=Neolewinella aurantiaca TaxID=2602767 RepID=A0A5C7FK57_9BACT|nr:preprotein translocase subunit YajC [Neolewinella aurantiaca]TXF91728.1 preprotein translocase subunit YajC [Neolewinella aurantiaca]